jgi:thiol:disulfide interchange protein
MQSIRGGAVPRAKRRAALLIGLLTPLATLVSTAEAQTTDPHAAAAHDTEAGPVQTEEPFTHERFEELQAEGALILVDVFATWCAVCAVQQRVLVDYRRNHPDVPLHTLVVDFDTQKDAVKFFKAPRQSTLVLYRGKQRLWFAVAEMRPEVITWALNEAAAKQ